MAKSDRPTENLVYHEAEFTSDEWNIPYPKSKIQNTPTNLLQLVNVG